MRIQLLFSLLAAAFVATLFNSCEKDEDDNPGNSTVLEDVMIPVDEQSNFNMTNFAKSYDQIFGMYSRHKTSISHEIANGKAIYSYQNLDASGHCGDKISTFTHQYNNDGIIVSTERLAAHEGFEDMNMSMSYEYNNEGFIIGILEKQIVTHRNETKLYTDSLQFIYNNENKLIKKTRNSSSVILDRKTNNNKTEITKIDSSNTLKSVSNYFSTKLTNKHSKRSSSVTDYTYYENGLLKTATTDNYQKLYSYTDDLIQQIELWYKLNTMIEKSEYEYDNQGQYKNKKWIDYDYDAEMNLSCSYSNNQVTEAFGVNNEDKRVYGENLKLIQYSHHTQYSNPRYQLTVDYDMEMRPKKISLNHYDTVGTETFKGYVIIEERDPDINYFRCHERYFTPDGELLYYTIWNLEASFFDPDYENSYWPDGTEIDHSEFEEPEWIDIYHRYHDYYQDPYIVEPG